MMRTRTRLRPAGWHRATPGANGANSGPAANCHRPATLCSC